MEGFFFAFYFPVTFPVNFPANSIKEINLPIILTNYFSSVCKAKLSLELDCLASIKVIQIFTVKKYEKQQDMLIEFNIKNRKK